MNKGAGCRSREREYFDRAAENRSETWWGSTTVAGIRRLERRAAAVAVLLSVLKNPAVLEIGCGTGALSGPLLERIPSLDVQPAWLLW